MSCQLKTAAYRHVTRSGNRRDVDRSNCSRDLRVRLLSHERNIFIFHIDSLTPSQQLVKPGKARTTRNPPPLLPGSETIAPVPDEGLRIEVYHSVRIDAAPTPAGGEGAAGGISLLDGS